MQINPGITSSDNKTNNAILPFAIITFIYFIVGFLTTVNEQLQAPSEIHFSEPCRQPEKYIYYP
jgi:FHS family L-fucose permease-like MFS transporter